MIKNRRKQTIGLFKFPDNERKPDLYKSWSNKIKTFRRNGGKDLFKVTNNTLFASSILQYLIYKSLASKH